MKLVSAKCPNCGANIEVDQNSDKTKCEYCESPIIVEDAIEKYKVELSGEVTVKNLPQVDALIKNANRAFDSKDYQEAYDKFDRVLDLDPDNMVSLFKKSLCKYYNSNHLENNISILKKALDNVIGSGINKEELHNYLMNIFSILKDVENDLDKTYINKVPNISNLRELNIRLDEIYTYKKELLNKIDDIDFKKIIIDDIIYSCDLLLKPRPCAFNYGGKNKINNYTYEKAMSIRIDRVKLMAEKTGDTSNDSSTGKFAKGLKAEFNEMLGKFKLHK